MGIASKWRASRAVGALLLVSATTVNAMLIDNGAYTTDAATWLDWLDLTATRGLSFDDVSSQMAVGQPFAGWRFASRAEVTTFWADAGGIGPFTSEASGETDWVGRLESLWGKTYPFLYTVNGYRVQGTIAMTSDASLTCSACNLTVYLLDNIDISASSVGDFAEAIQLNEAYRWQGQAPIGHALIRRASIAVPEPPTLAMLLLGLASVVPSLARGVRKKLRRTAA